MITRREWMKQAAGATAVAAMPELLGGVEVVELGLCFVAEKAHQLGQGYGLF